MGCLPQRAFVPYGSYQRLTTQYRLPFATYRRTAADYRYRYQYPHWLLAHTALASSAVTLRFLRQQQAISLRSLTPEHSDSLPFSSASSVISIYRLPISIT